MDRLIKDIAYRYDANGNRIQKISGDQTVNYSYEKNKIVKEEITANGSTTTIDYQTDDQGNLLALAVNGVNYYCQFNYRGDVIALTDASGTIVAKYDYGTWENVPFSQNKYLYALGDPINNIDPSGHKFEGLINFGKGAWEFLKPDEITVAWFQAGGMTYPILAPVTGAAGYLYSKSAKALKWLGKELLQPKPVGIIDDAFRFGSKGAGKGTGKGFEKVLEKVNSYEQARNRTSDIIGDIGPNSKPYIGRLGAGEGKIVGRQSADGKVRWRLDYDPNKGPHINIEDFRNGKGTEAIKIVIPFEGNMNTVEAILKNLNK